MTDQNSKSERDIKSELYHSLVFLALGLVGYAGFVWLRGNYLDALAMPLLVGFVWLAGMKQKLAWAVALVAFYVMLAVPAMAAGYMSWHLLTPILTAVVIVVLGIAMTKLPLRKSAIMVAFFVLSLALLFAFSFIEAFTFATLSVSMGAGLLSLYLFPQWRQDSPS